MPFCPFCGREIEVDAKFCSECGASIGTPTLPQPPPPPKKKPSLMQQFLYDVKHIPSRHRGNPIVLLGYLFAFLGGLVGVFLGYYLSTRPDPDLKTHGRIILTLAVLMFCIYLLAWNIMLLL